jgi:hypothetical protein
LREQQHAWRALLAASHVSACVAVLQALLVFKLLLPRVLMYVLPVMHAGVVLLLHLLAEWGCPPGLLAQLSFPSINLTASNSSTSNNNSSGSAAYSSRCSSRACLLCLAWLIGHVQLFDRALQHLQIPASLLQLLPPYPEVRSKRGFCRKCASICLALMPRITTS